MKKPEKMIIETTPRAESWVEKMFVGIDRSDRPTEIVTHELPPLHDGALGQMQDRERDLHLSFQVPPRLLGRGERE